MTPTTTTTITTLAQHHQNKQHHYHHYHLPQRLLVIPLLLLLLQCVYVCGGGGGGMVERPLVLELVSSIEKAAKFFADQQSYVNVDGLFGIQVAQGQLQSVERILLELPGEEGLRGRIKQVMTKMGSVIENVIKSNKKLDSPYYERFKPLISKPMLINWVPRWLSPIDMSESFEKMMDYIEDKGDVCLARILGTYIADGTHPLPKCNVTEECLDFMTTPNTSGYFLSHQLLYFMCIQKTECSGHAGFDEFRERPTVSDVERQLCSRMYSNAKFMARRGYVEIYLQDLFAEHNLLCGPQGFLNFIRDDWIKMLMSWQSPIGCFTDNDMEGSLYNTRSAPTMRKLMVERTMKNGCLSHKSGLGYGVLTVYLNGLLRKQVHNM